MKQGAAARLLRLLDPQLLLVLGADPPSAHGALAGGHEVIGEDVAEQLAAQCHAPSGSASGSGGGSWAVLLISAIWRFWTKRELAISCSFTGNGTGPVCGIFDRGDINATIPKLSPGGTSMRPYRNYRPRSISAAARLTETQRILRNLKDRCLTDGVIAKWLVITPEKVAMWRDGSAVPEPAQLASLRRLVRSARHG
jgi:hypothetical protein